MTSCSFRDERFDVSRKKSVKLKLKVRVKHIRLETMMNDLKLNVDGAVKVTKKNIFQAIQLMSTDVDKSTSKQAVKSRGLEHDRFYTCIEYLHDGACS